jgi:hypothetical protein
MQGLPQAPKGPLVKLLEGFQPLHGMHSFGRGAIVNLS